MKKLVLLSVGTLCLFSSSANVPPLTSMIFDDAVKGSGLSQHSYVGAGWIYGTTTNTFYNSTHSASRVAGTYVTFPFVGSKIEWYTEKKNTHGIVAISIDGGPETMIDLYSSTEQHILAYSSPILIEAPGITHTLKIRVTGTKNAASSNYYGIHDYLKIYYGLKESDVTNTSVGKESFGDVVMGVALDNSAFGYKALSGVDESSGNTVIGSHAVQSAYLSSDNTAVGHSSMNALIAAYGNTAVGAYSLKHGAGLYNTAIGSYSGPVTELNVQNTTAIGYLAKITASDQVRIGNSFVTSIGGQVSWSTLSDGRFKKDLREDVSGLDFVNGLRPVSYTIDNAAVQRFLGGPDSVGQSKLADREKTVRQTGFVAQEVDKLVKKSGYVFNGVDVPENDNDPYSIRYAEFVVPLVKAVQEMSAKLDDQQQQILELLEQLSKKQGGDNSPGKASEIKLFQNNPNPFSVNTEIKMVLPETTARAHVIVYNLEGKQLKEINVKERGNASVTILANELGAGMYIYALIVDGKVVDTKRMILTK